MDGVVVQELLLWMVVLLVSCLEVVFSDKIDGSNGELVT